MGGYSAVDFCLYTPPVFHKAHTHVPSNKFTGRESVLDGEIQRVLTCVFRHLDIIARAKVATAGSVAVIWKSPPRGSATYETTAAADYRSRKEGITRELAFAKELTPDRSDPSGGRASGIGSGDHEEEAWEEVSVGCRMFLAGMTREKRVENLI